jgi:hypothetical protein
LIAFIGKKHHKIIENISKKTYKDLQFEVVGSYRRKNKDLGGPQLISR